MPDEDVADHAAFLPALNDEMTDFEIQLDHKIA